jgi:hypothetical protein
MKNIIKLTESNCEQEVLKATGAVVQIPARRHE